MSTTGRCSAGMWADRWWVSSSDEGMRSPRTPTIFAMAPVHPDPAKMTTLSSSPPTASWIADRASSRSRVVWRPVPLDSVCVLA